MKRPLRETKLDSFIEEVSGIKLLCFSDGLQTF